MITVEEMVGKIKSSLPSADVKAQDLTGGGDHWRLEVKAEEFSGLNMVEQHKLVYQALGEWMKKEIHALSLDTKEKS